MRIAYNNEIDTLSAGTVVLSTTSGGQGSSNLLDTRLSSKWITSDATTQTAVLSFAVAVAVDTIGILGHNITTGCTVTVEANTADSWITPAYATTVTVYSGAMLRFLAAAQTYQYWRFSFAGQGDLEIGRLWLGEYISVSPSSLNEYRVTKERNDIVVYGRGRQKYANEGVTWRTIDLSFPKTNYTMIRKIELMIDHVGQFRSFIFCNFDTLLDYPLVEPMYCSINRDVRFNHINRQGYNYQLSLSEDL